MEIKNNVSKSLTLNNTITVDGTNVKGMTATINSDNPEDISFSEWTNDKTLYKAHRVAIRDLEADFEDEAYILQDEMIAEKQAENTTTEE